MKSHRLVSSAGFLVLALFAPAIGFCQSAPAQPASETVELSPFTVNADKDVGYLAANTLAGTRLNTPLRDTAASINIFTAEFMKDIGAFSLDDVMAYGVNLQFDRDDAGTIGDSPNGNSTVGSLQNYRSRGVNIRLARNYFISGSVPRDTFNLERIEQSRGPNSVLFGIGSAGGVTNLATKTGIIGRSFRDVVLSAGSDDSWRTALDVNQSLSNKGALRFNAVQNRKGDFRLFKDSGLRAANLAGRFQFLPKLELRAEAERGYLRDNSPRNTTLLDFNSGWIAAGKPLYTPTDAVSSALGSRLTTTVNGSSLRYIQNAGDTTGRLVALTGQVVTTGENVPITPQQQAADRTGATPLTNPVINTQGPWADRVADYNTHSAFLTMQIAKHVHAELAFNHELVRRPLNWNASQSERFYGDANATLPGSLGANPNAGRFYLETFHSSFNELTRADRGRFSLSAEQDLGRWGLYRVAGLTEREQKWLTSPSWIEVYKGRPFNSTPENAANQVIRRAYLTTDKWDTYYVTGPGSGFITDAIDPVSGRTLSSELVLNGAPSDVRYEQRVLLGALQASYFNGRLTIATGLRSDKRTDTNRPYVRDASTNKLVQDVPDRFTKVIVSGHTRTFGAVAHVTKNFDFIYNQADNFDLPQPGQLVLTGDGSTALRPPPNPAGKGQDYGIAATLFDGALYARVTRYTTDVVDRFNFQGSREVGPHSRTMLDYLLGLNRITRQEHDTYYVNNTGFLGDQSANGYEMQLTTNFKNWRFQGTYSIANAYADGTRKNDLAFWEVFKKFLASKLDVNQAALGTATTTIAQEFALTDADLEAGRLTDGTDLVGNRKNKGNFFTRYSFSSGRLKGAWVGGGYSYQSKMLANRNTTLVGLPIEEQLKYSAPVGEANAACGYTFRFGNWRPVTLTLNIRNLFNETKPVITRYSSTIPVLPRRMYDRAPRTWQLTADYSF